MEIFFTKKTQHQASAQRTKCQQLTNYTKRNPLIYSISGCQIIKKVQKLCHNKNVESHTFRDLNSKQSHTRLNDISHFFGEQ